MKRWFPLALVNNKGEIVFSKIINNNISWILWPSIDKVKDGKKGLEKNVRD